MIDYTKMDTSVDAKTKSTHELRSTTSNGWIYTEEKVYKGALCLGTKWEKKSMYKISR